MEDIVEEGRWEREGREVAEGAYGEKDADGGWRNRKKYILDNMEEEKDNKKKERKSTVMKEKNKSELLGFWTFSIVRYSKN
jgi:hypothetical protein